MSTKQVVTCDSCHKPIPEGQKYFSVASITEVQGKMVQVLRHDGGWDLCKDCLKLDTEPKPRDNGVHCNRTIP